ncbi:hypothetical protein BpHYR1_025556 [Brachionus plicatilis]|uniref:Uncharacterized protein n=1 Tax=Brachionus plicatilis TaxID=10195 RepID=A0A3M7PJU0_BRAPC|nr:hypothetical protein BpHYR1_025556 [Brachionus plicatilis]
MSDFREFGSFDNTSKKYFPNLAGLTKADKFFFAMDTMFSINKYHKIEQNENEQNFYFAEITGNLSDYCGGRVNVKIVPAYSIVKQRIKVYGKVVLETNYNIHKRVVHCNSKQFSSINGIETESYILFGMTVHCRDHFVAKVI